MSAELGLAKRAPGQPSAGRSYFSQPIGPRLRGRRRTTGVGQAPGAYEVAARRARADARQLLRDYHERGDLGARERVIKQYLPLVRSRARRFAGRGEPLEDLVQVGSIGLINAIDRYRLDRGVDLGALAIPTIDGEIKRYLRDRTWPVRIPRRLQDLRRSVAASAAGLRGELDRPGMLMEVALEVGAPCEDVAEALLTERSLTPLTLDDCALDEDAGGLVQPSGELERGYELGEDRAVLARGFRVLDARERRLLHLAFFRGLSQMQIAREVGISQIHVSRLTRRALEKLRAELDRDPLTVRRPPTAPPTAAFDSARSSLE
jgi:RNA polymerase sigma-B factor